MSEQQLTKYFRTTDKVFQNDSWQGPSEQQLPKYFRKTDKVFHTDSWQYIYVRNRADQIRQNNSRYVRATDYKMHQNNSWQNAYEPQLTKHTRTTADQVCTTSQLQTLLSPCHHLFKDYRWPKLTGLSEQQLSQYGRPAGLRGALWYLHPSEFWVHQNIRRLGTSEQQMTRWGALEQKGSTYR